MMYDEEGLLDWWRNVDGWNEWNAATNFVGDAAEQAIEAAADRVYKAARLFVYLFKKREASLYMRVVELLAAADAADNFHKKTVTASIGGGVASIAGGITTITGLALAPITFGSSLIVSAVGISMATAGGLTTASANITDTVHSRTDRAKVEQIILAYQEEIKDIRECLEFLQTGMETLEECSFQEYMESISKRAMNRNVKHVMKETGRAGKALLISAESLASTVQVLTTAGGVAKVTQVLSVTGGVMSGLFLALDVFFLARDSRDLHKGAKTKFAAKIRDVCKELLDGLIELKRIKEELQAIMSNAEEEEQEEEEDVEDEEEDSKKQIQ
ncbi:apolipoprotein L6-like isoform X2 [Silurus meridionalis]|uniref:apolipoprotein L6-like isoform X2 n=1 Tax=Silurus meridionalis TaxID=175797 RepID=UPI001EECC811|nr:apolipoprotein L6-like isoform X2 [Silurus meridionalis]